MHRSQPVAFLRVLAIIRDGLAGSGTSTAKGCRFRLPYGQLRTHRPQPTHQSSMMISIELRRRIEPTGQPTMHSGSRHDRHEVATRYLSKRNPSRTRRVTPSWASAHAFTH